MQLFDKSKVYTIKNVSEEGNIHPQTLRNWEKIGLLKPQRISGNQRIYTSQDLEKIEAILSLKNLGMSISKINEILETKTVDEVVNQISALVS